MNKRQKKKLFKRIHGYNPPKKMKLAAVSESDTIVFEMSELEYEELPIVQTTQILTERRGKRGWTRKRR